jgi:transcriptional regulator with XRE-family HTH domain
MRAGIMNRSTDSSFSALLREWRASRRMSQLELALAADVSSRHLSCLENRRALPGRDVLMRLAEALDMPLRDRNALLLAAGFAPMYPTTSLGAAELAQARRVIDLILKQQEPYPATLIDRHWNMIQMNAGVERLLYRVMGGRAPRHANMIRQIFDPEDVRQAIANWEEVAGTVIMNLQNELSRTPSDVAGKALLAEAWAYPGVPQRWRQRELERSPSPQLTTVFRDGDCQLSFVSTITTFATPRDVTLDELRIECCFPTDEYTAAVCKAMAEQGDL